MSENTAVQTLPRVSVSTWSLKRTIGSPPIYAVGEDIPQAAHGNGELTLLELPAKLAAFGIHTVEIVYFHLPTLERSYLLKLRQALDTAGVELFSLLIDNGDITHPQYAERDLAWISSFIEVAGVLGAKNARVIAGKSAPSEENLALSVRNMQRLLKVARENNVHLMTENWFALLSTPSAVSYVLDNLAGKVGLCFDFGNWSGATKYADLQAIAPYAQSCHTKAHFSDQGEIDREDYVRCLDITRAANFSGPYTLIYDGPNNDEWEGLTTELAIVKPYLTGTLV
ncbi:sugar phosphate isomerase/epimerase family protein [Dictyobacter arantiisoli]|uniref:Sugar phosphate isomerase n=1 Tax=Dictyobacter arantiisoli TaxID=2014874 RepID=A0A5A5T7C7_9CHLR|nr:sugar phosphate isomerase/epimerase [Dictyobacter arantiisoli]GCF07307.1 sugar phosphate isomerase [Dictyobacter arantiisoli]